MAAQIDLEADGEKEDDSTKAVSSGTSTTVPTKQKKVKKKKEASGVFESTPAASCADVQHGAAAAGGFDDAVECRSVFENQPREPAAEVRYDPTSQGTRAEEAKALIEAALQTDASGVYENQPRQTSADTSGNLAPTIGGSASVFESAPAPSQADVAYSYGSHAAAAEAQIQAAFDTEGVAATTTVFESQPRESSAAVRHGESVEAGPSTSVYESAPTQSRADVNHGSTPNYAAVAQAVIQEAAQKAPAEADGDRVPRNSTTSRPDEAAELIRTSATAEAGKFVFESVPQASKASVRYGEAAVSSSGEEETDDEEEDKDD